MWNWRRAVFYGLDTLGGQPFRRLLDELTSYDADPHGVESIARERLNAFLGHATTTTVAYRPYRGVSDLHEFPVVSKLKISRKREDFLSRDYNERRLPTTSTSGSYGTPFTFPLSWEKWLRQRAEVVHYSGWAGFELGEPHAFSGSTGSRKSRLTRFLQNEDWFNPLILTPARLDQFCSRLISRRMTSAVLMPSFALALARHSQETGRAKSDYALRGIVISGEVLDENTRTTAEHAFGCPVLGRYAAEEFGVIAHECLQSRTYHLNVASYFVELLAIDGDEPAKPGAFGRVIVTDPFSHALPLIRYDTGDLAIAGDSCDCGLRGPVLAEISGKVAETIYTPDGEPLHRMAIALPMSRAAGVVQFQFVQRSASDYALRLVVHPEFDRESALIDQIQNVLGRSARISVEYLEEIPPLPSGKRTSVINEWRPPAHEDHSITDRDASS
jgi:phenylacetate-CoA ligase